VSGGCKCHSPPLPRRELTALRNGPKSHGLQGPLRSSRRGKGKGRGEKGEEDGGKEKGRETPPNKFLVMALTLPGAVS